ncbi:GLE1-domain-containing protein, partial [Aureobasidium melanogenum]
AWRQRQDERDAEQERRHQQALAQAAAEHDRILRNAIEAAETEALKQERERKQKEEEERRVLEAERSAKAAREAAERQRKKEELERQELEQQKRAAEEREIQEQEARLAQQKRQNEADALRMKQEQEVSERKAKEEADAAAAAAAAKTAAPAPPAQAAPTTQQSQPQPASTPVTQPSTALAVQPISKPATQTAAPSSASGGQSALKSTPAQLEAVHNQYLAIHQRLKTMRETAKKQCDISERKLKITTVMGQFTPDKVKNRVALKRVLDILNDVLDSRPEPTIDVTPFLANPPDNSERHMPLALVFFLNLISKLVINQFCSDNIATIDALAIVLVTVFSKPEYLHNGATSLIDILLAKYHVVCPVLFGIYGNEETDQGKKRVGWWDYVSLEDHKKRMAGLATGYGCLSLRDFSKSKSNNPFPPSNYWRALSYFANTPPAHLQPTHWLVLKGLVDTHIEKFLKFYGQAGLAALRKVLVELPKDAPNNPAKDSVVVLPEMLRKTRCLTL